MTTKQITAANVNEQIKRLYQTAFQEGEAFYTSIGFHYVGDNQWGGHTMKHLILQTMTYMNRFSQSDEGRRDELIRIIEHSVEKLTLAELEALYYDMTTKSYIND